MSKKYLYEVHYLDTRQGNSRKTEVEAIDESDAYDQAAEDYYFGKLISIELLYEI